MDHATCVERLWSEYVKHGRLIVALDVDGTVFDFHNQQATYPRVIQLMRECEALGFYIMVFTARGSDTLPHAIEHVRSLGLTVASVNANPFPLPYGNNGKPYYNVLLDDRAGLASAYATLRAVVDRIHGKPPTTLYSDLPPLSPSIP